MPHMAADELQIGLLGCGTVGSAVVRLLQTNAEEIHRRTGVRLRIARIAAANPSKPRDLRLDPGILTGDARAVVADERIDVVAEVMGGIDPARALLLEAIRRGKSVVTANKLLMACHGPELFAEAARAGCATVRAKGYGRSPGTRSLPSTARARHRDTRRDRPRPARGESTSASFE